LLAFFGDNRPIARSKRFRTPTRSSGDTCDETEPIDPSLVKQDHMLGQVRVLA
jgi:hypothetical protein